MSRPLSLGSAPGRNYTLRMAPEDDARAEQIRRWLARHASKTKRPPTTADAIRWGLHRPLPAK